MKSPATLVYLLMLALFGAGLWVILSLGSILLRSPEDLAGQWQIFARNASQDDDPLMEMSIEQSGRYFKITLQGRGLDLKLTSPTTRERRVAGAIRLELEGGGTSARFEGTRGGDEFLVQFDGPIRGTWLARRVQRTYPLDAPHGAHASPATVAAQPNARL